MWAEKLFEEAKRCGVHKLVITEINNTASYIDLLRVIQERKQEFELQLVLGMEFREDHVLQFISITKNTTRF